MKKKEIKMLKARVKALEEIVRDYVLSTSRERVRAEDIARMTSGWTSWDEIPEKWGGHD